MTDKEMNAAPARVLIVEDEGIIAMRLERLLTRLGYIVTGMASTGEQALRRVAEQPPDLALMDIKLAGKMDGVETAARIRAQLDVPIVYLSAHPEEMVMEQVKRTQPYGFLSKPVRDQELQATVEMALYKHQMEARLKLSEERFRMTIQLAPIGVGIVNSEGGMIDCNTALAEMLGYTREELLDLHFVDFTHPDDLERERQLINELWAGEQPQYRMEKRYIHKHGHVIWVDVAASLYKGKTGDLAFGFAFVQDITKRVDAEAERTRAERALRKSEEQLAAIFEHAPIAMMILDRERRIHKINRSAAAFNERPADAPGNLRFGAALRCVHALDDPEGCGYGPLCKACTIRNAVRETFETGQSRHRVHATLTPTGEEPAETMHFLISTTPTRLSDEEMVLVYIEDVTERVRSDAAIKRRHRALEALNAISTAVNQSLELTDILNGALQETMAALDADGGLIYLLDPDTRLFEPIAHRGIPPDVLQEVTGFKVGEGLSGHVAASGQPLTTQLDADPRNISATATRRAWRAYAGVPIRARGQTLGVMTLIAYREDRFGAEHVQLLAQIGDQVGVAIENGRLYQSAQQEIAERERMEQALRQSEEKYRSYIDNAPDGIFISDANGDYLDVNPAACEITGYLQEELLAKGIPDVTPSDATEATMTEFAYLKSTGRLSAESPFVKKDGSRGYWAIEAIKLSDDRFLGFTKDITQRKQAEAQLKAALAEKETLLKEIYHRVKNNLQTLSSLINLQIESASRSDAPGDALAELQRRVDAMALVHRQLYQTGEVSRVNFGRYIEELAVQIIQAMRDEREIQLDVRANAHPLDIDAALPCGLIVNELLSNTMKYAFPEGWAGQSQIHIRFEAKGANYILTVSDNGVGLPPGLDWQTTDSLGLKLVKIWAVHQLKGQLDIDTRDGTTFTVTFPKKIE